MIHVNNQLLPEDQVKAIRLWLQEPAARYFIEWLSNQSAGYAAEAGNKLVEGGDSDLEDAKNLAANARKYLAAFVIMRDAMPNHFLFQVANMRAKPLSTEV